MSIPVELPESIPVELSIVARLLEAVQMPPAEVSPRAIPEPAQIGMPPIIEAGSGLTVMVLQTLQPAREV